MKKAFFLSKKILTGLCLIFILNSMMAVTPEEFENINISASDQKIIEWFK